MRYACVSGAGMIGHVPHHANHIIGYTSGEHPKPIYCSGHDVTGIVDDPGESKMTIEGKFVVVQGGGGPSTDSCDNSRFTNTQGESFILLQGRPIVLTGDRVDLNPGDGTVVSSNQSKFIILR